MGTPRRLNVRSFAVLSAGVALCAVAATLGAPASAGATGPEGHARAAKGGPHQGPSNLVDHGGKILTASKTYTIWWGNAAGFPSDAKTGLTSLLSGLGRSSYLQLASQYMRGAAVTSSFVTSYDDPSAPPKHAPQVRTIVGEVAKMLGATVPDPQAIYFVFTSNDPANSFCAWHSAGIVNGVTVQVAYMPNTDGVAGCDPGDLFSANTFTEGTRSIADSMAHEFMESVTDAVPVTAWADKNGAEIADKCNFVYGAPVRVGNINWQLQEEWSNAAGGCVQDTK